MPDKYALYDAAVDLVAEERTADAIEMYRRAIEVDEGFADAWQGLALALADVGRHEEAITAGKKVCELAPDDELAHTTLSRLYQQAGMIAEAEAEGGKARILGWKRQLKEGDGQ